MSSAEKRALFADSGFAYPSEYDPKRDRQFERAERFFSRGGPHPFTDYADIHVGSGLSTVEALLLYTRTPAGQWHANQRARYPSLHIDLQPELVGIADDDLDAIDAFRHEMLDLITHDSHQNRSAHYYGHQGFDLHPLGHQARVAMHLDWLFVLNDASRSLTPDPFLLQATRHASVHHDLDEAEFPGIRSYHGDVTGDIAASVGKTPGQRALGKNILKHIIKATFDNYYTDEFIQAVIAIASHDAANMDKQMQTYHATFEANHEMNTIETANYLAGIAEVIAHDRPMHANVMTALAFDSILRAIKKRNHLQDQGLTPQFATLMTKKTQRLFTKATGRDSDPTYTEWRKSDAAIEEFGIYDPNDPQLQSDLKTN